MKRIVGILSFIALFFIETANIYSQNWSKEQLEVWAVVEKSWESWKNLDIEGSLVTIHEDYQGWSNRDALPVSKALAKKMYEEMSSSGKISNFFINPARIVITGNAAVVDYVFEFSAVYTNLEAEVPYNVTGKNAEFYVKDGGNWLLLGDMTIMNSSDDDD
jgi:hypothetical protein